MRGQILVLLLASSLLVQTAASGPAQAKKFTISQREETLMNKINRGQRTNELTVKEANSLREDLADILESQDMMKENNGGKLSYADMTKLEKKLNRVSNKLHKKQLSKRID